MGLLIVCIALLLIGAYLFGCFEKLLGNAPRLLGLKPFEDKAAGTADLLNWAALVDEGVVQTKDGALLAGFFYQGKDLAASTADERNYITQRLNAALARLGNGWVSWHDAVRLPAAGYSDPELSHFPDHVTAAIDEERRLFYVALTRSEEELWCSWSESAGDGSGSGRARQPSPWLAPVERTIVQLAKAAAPTAASEVSARVAELRRQLEASGDDAAH